MHIFHPAHADRLAISLAFKSKDLAQAISAAALPLDYITSRSCNDRLRDRGLWGVRTPHRSS
jgi:hypothetical protein